MDRKVKEINLHIDSAGIVSGYLQLEKITVAEEDQKIYNKKEFNTLEIRSSSIRKMDGSAYSEEWNLFYRNNFLVTNISDDLYKRINDAIKEKKEEWEKKIEADRDFAQNIKLS